MGFMRTAARASTGPTSGLATPEKWVEDWFTGGVPTSAGIAVSQDTALTYSAFFGGVRVIAEDVGGLPLHLYERLEPRGKRRAIDHPLYPMLHDQANDLMSSVAFRETVQGHALTWGNGVAFLVFDSQDRIAEMWPLNPSALHIDVRRINGRLSVRYGYADEGLGIQAELPPDQVLHIAGLGYDGVRGYSVIECARNSLGLGMAAEHYGASFFGNGSRPGGVLQHPGVVSDPARQRMKTDWENMHRGLDRAQRVAILEEGVTWEQVGIPPNDAQFLETRKFQVAEMARWLRLPPHKLADLERATFSNIEEQSLDYVTSALRTWLVRWEQAIALQLLTRSERRRFFAEHLVDALLRGNIQARYQAYSVARQWGWMSADDVREKENENPLPDGRGEVYMVPLNMVPAPTPEQAEVGRQARRQLGMRGQEARRRIADSFAPLVQDADERIAKLERAEVRSLVRRFLEDRQRSTSEFLAEVSQLYSGRVTDRATKAFAPVLGAFAADIGRDAADDVGHEDELDLSRWAAAYTQSHVAYRSSSSVGQIRALTEGASAEDAARAVLERLDRWVSERPGRTAQWERTQMSSAAAREAWREAGVTRLRWFALGDTCPYCTDLDGKVVGIEEPFMKTGDVLDGGDGEQLTAGRNTFHPPAHPGCDCEVVPE